MPSPYRAMLFDGHLSAISESSCSRWRDEEIDPDGTEYKEVFGVLEYIFNFLFLIELILNMYGHWFFKFWRDRIAVFIYPCMLESNISVFLFCISVHICACIYVYIYMQMYIYIYI